MEIRLVLLILFFLCSSCNAEKKEKYIFDNAFIKDYKLTLSNINDVCVLSYSHFEKRHAIFLDLTSPCYFIRTNDQELAFFAYEDVNVLASVIVIGNPISEQKRSAWNLDSDIICGEKGQGIIIKQSGLRVTKKVLDGGVMCPKMGLDEKDFWYLAH